MPTGTQKLLQLEAIRGVASIIVVFHHFSLAFSPGLKQIPILFSGEAAVIVFFMLSGFVLTRGFFDRGGGSIGTAAVKRLPRLFLPVFCSVMLGYLILASGSTWHQVAGASRGSDYLKEFAWAGFPIGFHPSLSDAATQSLLVFLVPDHNWYNSNLWTMQPEFLGSMFCFAYAWLATYMKKSFTGLLLVAAIFIGWIPAISWLVPFAIGIAIAQYYPFRMITIVAPTGIVLIVIGLICLSAGHYSLTNIGAALIIVTALSSPGVASALSGRVGELLGSLSFPLYLTHALVLCSASSVAYVLTQSVVAAAIVTAVGSVALSIPLAVLDKWWVKTVNLISRKLIAWVTSKTSAKVSFAEVT